MSREIARSPVQGEVLDSVTITVREERPGGPWRLYPVGEGRDDKRMLKEKGRILGGRYEEALADADRIARENGFLFQRPSGLLLPNSRLL